MRSSRRARRRGRSGWWIERVAVDALSDHMIGLIVGNGLVFDYIQWLKIPLADWNPSNPTTWTSPPFLQDGRKLLDVLHRFSNFASAERQKLPDVTDFEIFDRILRRSKPVDPTTCWGSPGHNERYQQWFEHEALEVEARHFLVCALVHSHLKLIKNVTMSEWRWFRWLKEIKDRLSCITSFNYDILLETALISNNISSYRPALAQGESGHVPISKPHGSIDFMSAMPQFPPTYPITNIDSRNNYPVIKVSVDMRSRGNAEIVLPAAASDIAHFQWVVAGNQSWMRLAPAIEHLVLMGLSYWPCDRIELDTLINAVPSTAIVHMCNPNPSADWIKVLSARFGKENVKVWPCLPSL